MSVASSVGHGRRGVVLAVVAAMVGLVLAALPAAPAAATTPVQVVAWGLNHLGQGDVPAGLSDVTAISTYYTHSLALKSDGTVLAWGYNGYNSTGEASVPAGLSDVTAISAGGAHNLALRSNGTVVAWGSNYFGQSDVPGAWTTSSRSQPEAATALR